MKKYYPPIIALFIDISLHAFSPDLEGIRLFFQGFVYFSLFRILVLKTEDEKGTTNTLLKWTLGIGLVLPVILITGELLIINQIYIADLVILVPILFYELMRKDNGKSKSIDMKNNPQEIDKGDS
jgi:hypothetical protein